MNKINFTVIGKPMGKQRPQFRRMGRFTTTFTPKDTINYENLVKLSYQMEIGDFNFDKDIPLYLILKVYFPIPKGLSKRKLAVYESEEVPYTKKPDYDNVGKIICDALNGIAYYDDNQITDATIIKRYGKTARVEVEIGEVLDEQRG